MFLASNVAFVCGFGGQNRSQRRFCAAPATGHASVRRDERLVACNCQAAGLPRFCAAPRWNHTVACQGGDVGNTVFGPACCSATGLDVAHGEGNCAPGWSGCEWRSRERIGWLHTPKVTRACVNTRPGVAALAHGRVHVLLRGLLISAPRAVCSSTRVSVRASSLCTLETQTGTSFLLMLAHLASNHTLPLRAKVPSFSRSRVLQWEAFFARFPAAVFFRGSSLFWREGIAHASLSEDVYNQFRGRLFGFFREPHRRGASAYRYFLGAGTSGKEAASALGNSNATNPHSIVSPQKYATCIAGMQAGMLTGQVPTRAFGAVGCHVPVGSECDHAACPPFTPNLQLARARLDDGFTFVGIVEEWAMSVCLFSAKFRVRCIPQLFANSRPTRPTRHGRSSRDEDEALLAVFEDPHDEQVYSWARARFEHDLLAFNLTRARCARRICPEAAQAFILPPAPRQAQKKGHQGKTEPPEAQQEGGGVIQMESTASSLTSSR